MLQEKTHRWLLECGRESKFERWIHKVHIIEGEASRRTYVVQDEIGTRFKQLPDLRMCGLKYRPKLGKPLKREKCKSGQSRSQSSTIPQDCEEFTLLILMTKITKSIKNARRNLEIPMTAAMPCKWKVHTNTTKVAANQKIASQKILKTISESKATSGIFSTHRT